MICSTSSDCICFHDTFARMFGSFGIRCLYGLFFDRQSDTHCREFSTSLSACIFWCSTFLLELEALDLTAFPAATKRLCRRCSHDFLRKQTGPSLQLPSIFPLLFLPLSVVYRSVSFGGLSICFSPCSFALNFLSPTSVFPSNSSESAELFHQLNM